MIGLMQEHRRKKDLQGGFTLIELLIVITILGILSGVVVFAVSSNDRGESAAYREDARTLRTAQEIFCGRFGQYGTHDQLAGLADSPDGARHKFIAKKSTYHDVVPGSGGNCDRSGDGSASSFTLTCIGSATGCGGGGAITTGGTLVVAGGGLGVLNPATTSNGGVHANSEIMFNGLIGWSNSNSATPELAAAMPTTGNIPATTCDGGTTPNKVDASDQRCWFAEFTLRSGMLWHDSGVTHTYNPAGDVQPINADDVEFTFEEALLRYHARTSGSMGPALGVVQGATANATTVPADAITLPDGPTGLKVRFNFYFPYAPLLKQMNVTEAPIIPKHVYEHCSVSVMGSTATLGNQSGTLCDSNTFTADTDTSKPYGSGPFSIAATDALTFSEFNRNAAYFRAPGPYLAKVRFYWPGNHTNLAAARQTANSVDVASVPTANLSTFQNADYALVVPPRGGGGGNCITTLYLNLWPKNMTVGDIQAKPVDAPYEHPIFKEFAVRKAIFQAFDRPTAFTQVEDPQGVGRLADSPFHKNLTGAYALQTLPAFDPAQAQNDLAAAGWVDTNGNGIRDKGGVELSFDVLHFSGVTGTQHLYTQRFVSDMAAVGIEAIPNPQSNANTQTLMGQPSGVRAYDSVWFSHCHGDDPVVGVRRAYHSDQIQATAFVNVSGYRSSAHDTLWWEAAQALNSATYASKYNQIQQQIVADLPGIWMGEARGYRGTRAVCGGFNHNNTGLFVENAYCAL